jgi:PPE-repeat protein
MDFALLPPEINSARMYTGPGAGSLLAAAGSWDALSAELDTTAETYGSVLSTLNSLQWRGPASESMTAAAIPYVGWLHTTAEQTRQAAIQARAAAAAYEQAYTMTVPPPLIAANRTLLMSLIATNFFGQNTAAIATTEAQYFEMWAQDAAAMTGYATDSAAVAQLTTFTSPAQTTSSSGLSTQSAAVAQAASAAAADPISQLVSGVQSALSALAAPSVLPEDFAILDGILGAYSTIGCTQNIESITVGVIGAENNLGLVPAAAALPVELAPALTALQQSAGAATGLGGGGLSNAVLASVGRANSIGPLSVPVSWSAPSSGRISALAPAGLTAFTGTEEAVGSGMPGVPGMPAPTLARGSGVLPRYGVRLSVMAHPPAAG